MSACEKSHQWIKALALLRELCKTMDDKQKQEGLGVVKFIQFVPMLLEQRGAWRDLASTDELKVGTVAFPATLRSFLQRYASTREAAKDAEAKLRDAVVMKFCD